MATKHEFGEIQRKNMEAAMRLAQLSIENSQRIMALQSQLARELFQESVEQAKAQTGSSDPQEIMNLRARYAQDTTQKMIAAAQQVAEIGNNARMEFSRLLTEQLAAGSQDMVDPGEWMEESRLAMTRMGHGRPRQGHQQYRETNRSNHSLPLAHCCTPVRQAALPHDESDDILDSFVLLQIGEQERRVDERRGLGERRHVRR